MQLKSWLRKSSSYDKFIEIPHCSLTEHEHADVHWLFLLKISLNIVGSKCQIYTSCKYNSRLKVIYIYIGWDEARHDNTNSSL